MMYIGRNKSKIYYVYYKKNSSKTRVSTKTKYKKEALKFLNDFEKKIKENSNVSSITLNELKVKYLGVIEITHTKKSWKLSRASLEKFIETVGGDTQLKNINKSMAESFILNIYQRAKYSAMLHKRHLHAIFNKAIEWEYLEKNPFKGIKLRIPQNNPIFINKDELDLILKLEKNSTLNHLYKFAFYTGMRISEITHLEWKEIQLHLRTIRVINKIGFTTKSKKERVIPMSIIVFDILSNVEKNSTYVFSKNQFRFKPDYVSKQFKKCIKATNLNQKIHFHTLRHSFASNLVQKGASIYAV